MSRMVALALALTFLFVLAPSPAPATAAPTCTQFIGFSQTQQWYTSGFDVGDRPDYELRWNSGGSIEKWANPAYAGWGDRSLIRHCASSSDKPQAVVLTISGGYGSNVGAWEGAIQSALQTLRAKYPTASRIYLQPVAGGPNGQICTVDVRGKLQQVRASVNHPHIRTAISAIATKHGDVTAGAAPQVRRCTDYADRMGHLTLDASTWLGQAVADAYGL